MNGDMTHEETTLRAKLVTMTEARDGACNLVDALLQQLDEIIADIPGENALDGLVPAAEMAEAMSASAAGMLVLREIVTALRKVGAE